MKMILITYNHSLDDEMVELIESSGVSGWTRIEGVTGTGGSEPHMGSKVWPATNNMLFTAVEDRLVKKIKAAGKKLAERFPDEGMRIFIWTLTEMH